jgi:hypothetical protein
VFVGGDRFALQHSRAIDSFTESTAAWTFTANGLPDRCGFAAAAAAGGYFVYAGGEAQPGTLLSSAYVLSIPACTSSPCLLGTCSDVAGGTFVCVCPAGYSGRFCETNINGMHGPSSSVPLPPLPPSLSPSLLVLVPPPISTVGVH